MPFTATPNYTSSVTLVILGKSLEPTKVSATLGIECHESWVKGQPKRVGADLHQWGGWKRFLPEVLKATALEEQLNFWIGELCQKAESLASIVDSGASCSLDVFVCADAAWFKLSQEVNQRLAALPLNIEFTFWSSDGAI